MYVPPRYVALFLNQDRTPADAYTTVVQAAAADGTVEELSPLVNWLLLAMTRAADDQPSVLARPQPQVPLADQTLLDYRWSILIDDLPALDTDQIRQQGYHQVAAQVGALAGEIRQGNHDARLARAKSTAPKTPDDYFGPRLLTLLWLCQVATPDALPPVYAALANTKRKQERLILQQHIDEVTDNLNMYHKVIITPALAKKLSQVEWAMTDDQNLDHGIHHFHVTFRTPREQEVLRRLVQSYALVAKQDSSATLTLVTLRSSWKPRRSTSLKAGPKSATPCKACGLSPRPSSDTLTLTRPRWNAPFENIRAWNLFSKPSAQQPPSQLLTFQPISSAGCSCASASGAISSPALWLPSHPPTTLKSSPRSGTTKPGTHNSLPDSWPARPRLRQSHICHRLRPRHRPSQTTLNPPEESQSPTVA